MLSDSSARWPVCLACDLQTCTMFLSSSWAQTRGLRQNGLCVLTGDEHWSVSHAVGLMGRAKKIWSAANPTDDRGNQDFLFEGFCWIGPKPVEARGWALNQSLALPKASLSREQNDQWIPFSSAMWLIHLVLSCIHALFLLGCWEEWQQFEMISEKKNVVFLRGVGLLSGSRKRL